MILITYTSSGRRFGSIGAVAKVDGDVMNALDLDIECPSGRAVRVEAESAGIRGQRDICNQFDSSEGEFGYAPPQFIGKQAQRPDTLRIAFESVTEVLAIGQGSQSGHIRRLPILRLRELRDTARQPRTARNFRCGGRLLMS